MSVQSEIDRINGNVSSTYSVLSDLGAAMPATLNTDNLAATAGGVAALLYIAQTLTEAQMAQARQNMSAAPAVQYGTEDVEEGAASPYPEGTLYVVLDS